MRSGLSFTFLLLALILGLTHSYVIDRFLDSPLQIVDSTAHPVNPDTIGCVTPPESATIGGARDAIVHVDKLQGEDSIYVQIGCETCQFTNAQNGLLSYSTPPSGVGRLSIIWDGKSSPCSPLVTYNGLAPTDLTDNGISDSFVIDVGTNDVDAQITITVYSGDSNHASFIFFAPDPDIQEFSLLQLPFANTQIAPGASFPADFTKVTAIRLDINSTSSVDLSFKLVQTAPLLLISKAANLTLDSNNNAVANPGDRITYTIYVTNEADGLQSPVAGVYVFDDPSQYFPYYTLVPNSVTVGVYVGGPNYAILDPSHPITVISGNAAADKQIIVNAGTLDDDTRLAVSFTIIVGNLPCCLPTCDIAASGGLAAGCQISGQSQLPDGRNENCYCIKNQAYQCSNLNAADVTQLSNSATNFAWAALNCVPTQTQTSNPSSGAEVFTPIFTRIPTFATFDPHLTLAANASTASIGSRISVTANVGNTGPRTSAVQTLTLSYPSSLVSVTSSSGWDCTVAGTCTRNLGALGPDAANVAYSIVFTVSDTGSCLTAPLSFNAMITPTGTCPSGGSCLDSNLNNNNATSVVSVTGSPDLFVTKNAQSASVVPGGNIVYTILYGNLGTVGATAVVLSETLPTGTTYAAAAGEAWSCNATTCTLAVANVPSATNRSTTFTVTYSATTACADTTIPNTVRISSSCTDINTANNVASASVTINATPDLVLTKTGTTSTTVGGVATYTITYRNQGNRGLTNVVLTENVPTNTAFSASASDNRWGCTAGVCTISIGNLAAGSAPASVTFAVNVNSGLACGVNSITNTASINGLCVTAFARTATASTTITGQPDLAITKTVANGVTTVQPGNSVTYIIGYSNVGTRPAPGVVITENVPTSFTFVAGSSTAGWTAGSGGSYVFNIPTVAAGASGSVNFTTQLASIVSCNEPARQNTVSISTTCSDSEVTQTNNQASASVGVGGAADLTISSITVNPTSAPANSTVVVTIFYANIGTATATNASISVPLPSRLTNAGNPSWTFNGNTFTKVVGDIAPGATQFSQSLTFRLPSSLACNEGLFTGNATITNGCGDVNLTNNFNVYQTTVLGQYDLYILKGDNDAVYRQRSSVVYSINYGNAGIRAVDSVVITETIPASTTFSNTGGWNCPAGTTGGNTCSLSISSLAAGQTGTVNVTFTIVDPIPFGLKSVNNHVTISATGCGGDSDLSNNQADEPTPVVGNPDLYISKTDNNATLLPQDDGSVVYTITYGNIGDIDASNVVITERVPLYTVFTSIGSSPNWSCPDQSAAGTMCSLTIGTVAAGATGTVRFAVIPYSYIVGQRFALHCPEVLTTNFVYISGDVNQIEKSLTNNNASDTTPMGGLPDLRIFKTDNIDDSDRSQFRRAGSSVTYVLSWSNRGPREATNVVVTDTVPQYTTFDPSLSSPGWSCASGGGAGSVCTLNAGTLAPGATGSASFVVRVGTFASNVTRTVNNANITNSCGESNSQDNFATDTTPLTGFFDLIVQKHGHCSSIVWTLTYSNVGDLTSRLTYLKTHVPSDTTFNANKSDSAWVCANITAGSECLLNLSRLEPGAGGSVDFVADPIPTTMHAMMGREYTLFASIDDDWRGEGLDPTPENNRAQATIGFDGCDTCDSCCPPVDTCCPDQTDVSFNFGGVLDGLKTCGSS